MRGQEAVVALGRHRRRDRADPADSRASTGSARALLALGAAELRDLSVSIPARRDLSDAAGRGSRAAAADGPADARQPLPRGADRVLPCAEGDGALPVDPRRLDAALASSTQAVERWPPESTSSSRPRSSASGTTRSPPSGATCACGSTRSRTPATDGCRSRFEWAFGFGRRRAGRGPRPRQPPRAGAASTAGSCCTARSISSRSVPPPASCASPITRPARTAARTG